MDVLVALNKEYYYPVQARDGKLQKLFLVCWIAQEMIVNYQWRLIKQYGVYWYVIALLIGGGDSLCVWCTLLPQEIGML